MEIEPTCIIRHFTTALPWSQDTYNKNKNKRYIYTSIFPIQIKQIYT